VKRGLVKEPAEWKWSSFRHYALREIGIVEIESAWTAADRKQEQKAPPRECSWGTARKLEPFAYPKMLG